MKTIRRLNIKDKPDYFFMNMTNINNFDQRLLLISEITTFSRSTMFEVNYCEDSNTPSIVFDNIACVFRKSGLYNI